MQAGRILANKFSDISLERLNTAEPELVELFHHVLQVHDCSILEGFRDAKTQNEYFAEGKSKVQYPDSKHNTYPSRAVDVAPYPIDWADTKRFYYFAGIVKGVAAGLDLDIRYGGDWDSDNDLNDQTFQDLVHFELV